MLGKPVIELEVGSYNIPTTEDQRAGSEVVTTIDEADAAIRAYLSGRPISTGQQTARDAFLKEFCYRIDGKAAERCAAIIHATVCNLSYTEAERQAMQTKTASLHANWKRTQARRLPNRLKDAIGIPRHTSLRFWKKLRLEDADGNLGLLSPEIEITRAMVEERYCGFDRILPAAALTCPASSVA